MSKALVIVESPAKARTIQKYLGPGFEVKASVGHIKDLPKSRMGVDVEAGFEPQYEVIRGKGKVVAELRRASKNADVVYLAPDPDREGEAIAWHILSELKRGDRPVFRILINEITKRGVTQAINNPLPLNRTRFESQQARRILDRLVGYQLSPLLWEKVRRGLSAGRVQSVAVRLIVEREQAIRAFEPVEHWLVDAHLQGGVPPAFKARLFRMDGKPAKVPDEATALEVRRALDGVPWTLTSVKTKQRKRRPAPPFTTSKLQQEASRHFGFGARRTMQVAQKLYEGISLGPDGLVGLITYMRTDSTRLSQDALDMARLYIEQRYGKAEVPAKPNVYKSGKGAQDAHEAVRPTSMKYPPEKVAQYLTAEQARLYGLIWRRFVASQMKPAIYDATTLLVSAGERHIFRATGSVLRAAGFEAVYRERRDDQPEEEAATLPPLSEGDVLRLLDLTTEQRFTKPPPRFTDATLVRELEEKGIGRPSTYASIIETILAKAYVIKEKSRFSPTELGEIVTELLVDSFPDILNVEFTAAMERQLDSVEEGSAAWQDVLQRFYDPFKITLESAKKTMRDVKREEIPTDVECARCGAKMVIKWGKNGRFLACPGYPECKNTKEFRRGEGGQIEVVEDPSAGVPCPTCQADMVIRNGRFGRFLACSRYPECKTTAPIDTGVKCPTCGVGSLVEKQSRKGKVFFSCNTFPDCKFALWDRPLPEACPRCDSLFLVERKPFRGRRRPKDAKPAGVGCPTCDYMKSRAGPAPASG